MFEKGNKGPGKMGPVLVHENPSPDRSRVTYATRAVFDDLCGKLEKFEDQGWEVHTVSKEHSNAHGDYYWVLLRKPGQPKSNLPRTKA